MLTHRKKEEYARGSRRTSKRCGRDYSRRPSPHPFHPSLSSRSNLLVNQLLPILLITGAPGKISFAEAANKGRRVNNAFRSNVQLSPIGKVGIKGLYAEEEAAREEDGRRLAREEVKVREEGRNRQAPSRRSIKDFNQTPVATGNDDVWLLGKFWHKIPNWILQPARGPWMARRTVKGHLSLYMDESATKYIASRP